MYTYVHKCMFFYVLAWKVYGEKAKKKGIRKKNHKKGKRFHLIHTVNTIVHRLILNTDSILNSIVCSENIYSIDICVYLDGGTLINSTSVYTYRYIFMNFLVTSLIFLLFAILYIFEWMRVTSYIGIN